MTECLPKNFIDYEEYPQCADIQNRCVNMIADLFHAPAGSAVGTSSVGSSEAIMLAVLAMKKRWRQRREVEGKPADRPNLVMSAAVQVCWEKAVRYFEVEPRLVYCTPERFVIDPAETVSLCDENTIGICAILGTTYTGEYEDVKGVNDLLVEKDMDVPIHVDAASGGFVAPFVVPDLEWDFRCEKVVSINASGHKVSSRLFSSFLGSGYSSTKCRQYGLVYPGVGWVVWRSPEFLPQELVFNINYLGANQASFTLNFSKSASQVVGQYYQLIRLGRRGYRSIMSNLTRTADFLSGSLAEQGFVIMSKASGEGLPLVAFRFPDGKEKEEQEGKKGKAKAKTKKEKEEEEKGERQYDEFALARSLRSRGWVVPAYTMAPHTGQLKMLRVVVREDFSRSMCDMLIADIKLCCALLEETDRETLQRQESLIRQHALRRNKRRHAQSVYKVGHNVCPSPPFFICFGVMGCWQFWLTTDIGREALAPGKDGQDTCSVLRGNTGQWGLQG